MNKTCRKPIYILLLFILVLSVIEIPTGYVKARINLALAAENSLIMDVRAYPDNAVLCVDGISPIILDVSLFDSDQNPVPFCQIHIKTQNFSAEVNPVHPVTGRNGRVTITVLPKDINWEPQDDDQDKFLEIPATIEVNAKKALSFRWDGKLAPPPVLLIHGFQDSSESMVPMKNYLTGKGLLVYSMDYATDTDIETMSAELEQELTGIAEDLKSRGIYAEGADIVAHSLGGIVARYYTTRRAYIEKRNVHKLIFINVPHHGTPWAEAGAEILESPFLKELYPTSSLFTSVFPNSINKGLNHNIQTANIALDNDEVVPLPGAMLTSWSIETKIYRIGSEPLSLDKIISDQISGTSRHRQLLFYTPVFEEIIGYLTNSLPYPQKRK